MDEAARLLTLLALAGGALTLVGGIFAFYLDETRRIRRTLTAGLGAVPQPMLAARGRGRGIGFDLTRNLVCVTWDKGAWRLDYRLGELMGVELIVDRTVAARAFRGEPRRALDQLAEPQERVRLRFVFDDAAHPDFHLDLWLPQDDGLQGRMDGPEALAEANRWMARMEALFRRTGQGVGSARPAVAPTVRTTLPQAVARAPAPLFDDDETDDAFEDEPEDRPLTM